MLNGWTDDGYLGTESHPSHAACEGWEHLCCGFEQSVHLVQGSPHRKSPAAEYRVSVPEILRHRARP